MKKRVNSDPQGRVKVAKSLRLQGRAAWMTNLGAYPVFPSVTVSLREKAVVGSGGAAICIMPPIMSD